MNVLVDVVIWGIFAGVFGVLGYLFFKYTPYFQRTKRKVVIFNTSGQHKKTTVGWLFNKDGVEYFRVLMSGFPAFRGINLDRSFVKTADQDGTVELVELTPDLHSPENYQPKNVPITQKDAFVQELLTVFPEEEQRNTMRIFVENLMQKYSRVIDLSESRWLSENLAAKKAQEIRARGDLFWREVLPYLALVVVGIFTYLVYQSLSESFTKATENFAVISAEHTKQIVEACGGTYNNTTVSEIMKPQNFKIPIIQK